MIFNATMAIKVDRFYTSISTDNHLDMHQDFKLFLKLI